MESLLSYFLRKDNRFAKEEDIPAELKKSIKEAVQNNAANYQKKYGISQATEEIEVENKKNVLQSLFSKFKKS